VYLDESGQLGAIFYLDGSVGATQHSKAAYCELLEGGEALRIRREKKETSPERVSATISAS